MKLFIKTVKNIKFDIHVKPEDKIYDAKKIIETVEHADFCPAAQQKLIHGGKILEDETTFTDNNITENSSIVVMNSKAWDGISVIELFYMKYVSHQGVMPEKQLGTISLIVDDILFDLYRERYVDVDKPSIEFMDYIPLVGIGPIYSELQLEFLALFCGTYNGSIEVSPETFRHRDGVIQRSIQSVNGSGDIDVLFGYFNDATIATVEVQLLDMSPSSTINVYGVIASTNSHFDNFSSTNILFWKKSTDRIEVCSTEEEHERVAVIPLSKSRVGVPLGSVMFVDISLTCDDKDYQGTANFDTFIDGTDSQVVANRFLVKVTWSCSEFPILEEEYDSDYSDISDTLS